MIRIIALVSLSALLGTAVSSGTIAQQVNGTLGSPSATTTIQGNQIPAPEPKFGGVIKENSKDSKPWWPPRGDRSSARLGTVSRDNLIERMGGPGHEM